ncbi:MAG: hypothetical protein E7620_04350 [Ruminococcaceae bacterium]|nr:hypothetical protein [Oscillospiraceae bacterium]
MPSFLSLLIPAILMLVAVAWGLAIGLGRTRARFICVAACFVVALVASLVMKDVTFADVKIAIDFLVAQNPAAAESLKDIMAFVESSQPLQEALLSCAGAVVAPLVFFTIFVTLSLVTWIVGAVLFVVTLFIPKGKRAHRGFVRVLIYAVAQVLLTVFVIMTPVVAYLDCVPDVVKAADQIGMIESEPDNANNLGQDQILDFVEEVETLPLVVTYRFLGGDAMCNSLTSIKIGEEKTTLSVELGSITRFVANVMKLTENEMENFGEAETQAIESLSQCFGESVLLPSVAGELIYGVTDAWLSEDGNTAFLGMEKPAFDESTTAMFADAFRHILEAFHTDARNVTALCADFDTLADIVGILVRDGVFAGMGEDSTTSLVNTLSSGNTVKDLITALGSNSSFKILISDVTNIGMRAIGSSLKIPENAEAIYQQFTDDIAAAMNTLMSSEKTEEEKKAELTAAIKEAFAESGNELALEDDVIGLYAETLLEDFANYENITADDVSEFFQVFAEVNGTELDLPGNEQASSGSTTLLGSFGLKNDKDKNNNGNKYKSPAYAGKTTEQLKNESAAGLLATVLKEVVTAAIVNADNEEAFQESVKNILTENYKNYAEATGKDASKAESFATSVVIKMDSITEETINTTAVMQSPAALKEVTTKVTIEDLLVDAEESAGKLDSAAAVEKEAEAIKQIFNSAGEIVTKLEEGIDGIDGIGEIAGSLGTVLDGLSGTASFGEEKTDNLLFAVLQSETVRESANIDHKTATELAKAATEKNPDGSKGSFTETMNSLATGANIANKLTQEDAEITEDDIREMLENMTPQTANMLKAYMTVERMRTFGVPEDNVELSTELIQNMLTEMGDKQKYSSSYDAQTKAILKIFNMVSATSKQGNNGSDHLFNRSNNVGLLNATAEEVVSTILDSDMVCNAVMKTLKSHDELKVNPFGLNIDEGSDDYVDCKNAVEKYYKNHTEKGDELKERLDAIAALLGVTGLNYED